MWKVKRECVKQTENMEIDELKSIRSLGEESTYKFLGVLENYKQEDKLVLENASKEYLRRLAIFWSNLKENTPKDQQLYYIWVESEGGGED